MSALVLFLEVLAGGYAVWVVASWVVRPRETRLDDLAEPDVIDHHRRVLRAHLERHPLDRPLP